MKKLIAIFSLAFLPLTAMASGGGVALEDAGIDLADNASIQRGAKYFVNYCMGCHSNKHVRYKQFTKVGLTEEDIKDNLIFNDAKVGSHMTIAMPDASAAEWFGAPAPDLTLTARIRTGGADWIYTYLKGFYSDPSRPMGVNNTIFPNVGMPNILWKLQGIQEATFRYEVIHDGHAVESFASQPEADAYVDEHGAGYTLNKVVDSMSKVTQGSLSDEEFDQVARDISTYLAYVSEPMKLERQSMGVWVMLFLLVFTVLAYLTKKEWFKDVH